MNLDNMSVDGYSSVDDFIEDNVDGFDEASDTTEGWDETEIEKLILDGGYEYMDYEF